MMDDGICDVDIAAAFGVEPETVAQWRRRAKADVWRPVRSERDFSRFPIRRVDGQKRARK